MKGEIDLELYTISIIRLNNAFQKLEDEGMNDAIIQMFKDCVTDFEKLYYDIVDDLNQDEVNFGEYYPFFENGKQTFPQYIEVLESCSFDEISDSIESLINVFRNLNKIAKEFKSDIGNTV